MKVAGPSPFYILVRNKARLDDQVLQRAEKLSIKMCEIVKEMSKKMPETFLGFQVLLPTMMTIPVYYLRPTIQAVLFLALGKMGQIVKFSLK